MLNTKLIDGLKAKDKQYKVNDTESLYLIVTPRSVKSWRTNYKDKLTGKYKTHTFGRYPEIGLAKARLLNSEFKDKLEQGISRVLTFDEVKDLWLPDKLNSLKNFKHKIQVTNRVNRFASPIIGSMPIDTIKRTDLVKVVKSVQELGIISTAHTVGILLRQILDYALDNGYIESHSASGLSRVLKTPKVNNMNCIDIDDAQKLFNDIKTISEPITRLALIFASLAFVRSSELRYMTWSEIKDKRFWVIPSERMKMKIPHVVPLSDYALSVLEELRFYNGDKTYVFNSPKLRDKPISENTMLDALYKLGYKHKMTVHGFRSLASTILNEQSNFRHDVIERQLAHKENDAVRAAYNRADYLDERIKLMDWWSDLVQKFLLTA
jgi:integrase